MTTTAQKEKTDAIPATIQTTIHVYYFDTSTPADKTAYDVLSAQLTADGCSVFKSLSAGPGHYEFVRAINGQTIDLETAHLFNNQWNTAPIVGVSDSGLRVFDWAEDAIFNNGGENRTIKRGHYLTQTIEMRAIRARVRGCGYCGKQTIDQTAVFCMRCIDNEYLKETELHLLRLLPVAADRHRAALTDAERVWLLPIYLERQRIGTTERDIRKLSKRRSAILQKHADVVGSFAQQETDATTERDGMLWVLDHCSPSLVDNVIFYKHTQRFGFGWRDKLTTAEVSALLDIISEFPYRYTLTCADGRKLENE